MLYTPLTKTAMKICIKAHEGQVDKSGMPYLLHPFIVAEQMEGEWETCAALLHDVLEDSHCSLDDLSSAGMPKEVIEAVRLLTRDSQVLYMDYIKAIKGNCIACKVKLADLEHNMDLERLDSVTAYDIERANRYCMARDYLLSK